MSPRDLFLRVGTQPVLVLQVGTAKGFQRRQLAWREGDSFLWCLGSPLLDEAVNE